jgi:hypothetical protein
VCIKESDLLKRKKETEEERKREEEKREREKKNIKKKDTFLARVGKKWWLGWVLVAAG